MTPTLRSPPLLATIAICVLAGCDGEAQSVDARQAAAQNYEQAAAAFEKRDYATAEGLFTAAIEYGLSADAYAQAAVKRTVCWGAAGKYDEAIAELEKLEAAAPNLDQVFAARSYVLAKQGQVAASKAAFAKAQQINRTVQEFKD